jgi:hypothetical protein
MRRLWGWLLIGHLVWACGGDDATPPGDGFSAQAALATMTRAFDSLETAGGGAFGSSGAALDTNPLCNEKGEPVISGTTTLVDRSSPEFSAQLFYCATSFNSLSSDTVQGTLAGAQAILCGLEDQELLTYDGVARSGTFEATAACFPEGLLEPGMPTTFDVTITAAVVSAGGWTHQIRFQSTDLALDMTLKFLFDERFLGFFSNEGTLLLLDFTQGIARFETLFAQHDRHLRLLAEGTLETDGSFTALTRLEGAWSQGGGDATSPQSIATLFGTDSGGYRTYSFNFDGAAFTQDAVNCTGTGDCSVEDGLVFSDTIDEGYLLHSTDSDVATFLQTTDPLCLASVTSGRFPDVCDPRTDL